MCMCMHGCPHLLLQAATIAMQHQRHRLQEVIAAVAQQLVGVGRTAAAAELQEGTNDIQGEPLSVQRFILLSKTAPYFQSKLSATGVAAAQVGTYVLPCMG